MKEEKSLPEEYDPLAVQLKWTKKWEEEKIYQPDLDKAKKPFFNLMMFPYPSAEGLHVGSVFTFSGVDAYGRFKRMQGYNVFEPIGLDGFGIHSENYAIKVGRTPQEHAQISQKNFYRQLSSIGNGFDWSRKLETYDPAYYKWTQWLFIQLFNEGLAYRKKSPVNYCPSCKTVLADEQVINGTCERCGTSVEKRNVEQWFFQITKYADRLLHNIEKLNWTEKVKIAQRNWIGKKNGITIRYPVKGTTQEIACFTTRPDTNFGSSFVVAAPEHDFVKLILNGEVKVPEEKRSEIESYVKVATSKSQEERISEGRKKTGVFTGLYLINRLNGKELPLWISDFVLPDFGTGAVVGVPGHDLRDFQFAQQFGIKIIRVVVGKDNDTSEITKEVQIQEGEGTMIHSGFLDGLKVHDAIKKITDFLEENGWGERVSSYHLRDWLISRQRYWGPPIPMIHCEVCGWVPVPQDQLPVLLPELDHWKPTGDGKGPLAKLTEWVHVSCPKCHGPAYRETDVSDSFLDSSWYFFRYTSTDIKNKIFDVNRVSRWLPVTMYIGGAEHSVLHLLYARFITMVLCDKGIIEFEEPFTRFYAHGLVIKDGAKMSKSKGNVIIPDEYISKVGSDTLRTYLMFLGPFNKGGDFRDSGIEGMHRFMKRVWRLALKPHKNAPLSPQRLHMMHKTIKKVTEDFENLRYNTAIATLMEYYNFLSETDSVAIEEIKIYLQLLAPFAPFITEELWQWIGKSASTFSSIHTSSWPSYDQKYLVQEQTVIIVQVNGKVKHTLNTSPGVTQDVAVKMARETEKINKILKDTKVQKIVYIPDKVLNFVII